MSLSSKQIDLTAELALIIGDSTTVRFSIKTNTAPINLTGCTARCSIRKYWNSPPTLEPLIQFVDRPAGIIEMSIAAIDSQVFTPQLYRYAIHLTMPNNTVYTPIYGNVEFTP